MEFFLRIDSCESIRANRRLQIAGPSKNTMLSRDIFRECVNREVQTLNREAGKEGAVERGVREGPEKGAKTLT